MKNIYFDGCGVLLPYYFGVVRGLEDIGINTSEIQIGGTSAGSIVAMMLALNLSFQDMHEIGIQLTTWKNTRKHSKFIYLKEYLDHLFFIFLQKLNHQKDIDEKVRKIHNLHIRVAEWTPKGIHERIIRKFDNFEELRSTVYGSCNLAPFFNGFTHVKGPKGQKFFDGVFCFTNNHVFKESEKTITVSPLHVSSISPSIPYPYFRAVIAYHKTTHVIEQGYVDCIQCFKNNKKDDNIYVYFIKLVYTLLLCIPNFLFVHSSSLP